MTLEGLISPSERSQSSEVREREDSVRFSLKDMEVVAAVMSGVDWHGARDGGTSEAGMGETFSLGKVRSRP